MSRIQLTIDQLVLRGFESSYQKPVVEGIQSEFSRLLADPVTRAEWAHSHRTPVLKLVRMPLEGGTTAARKLGRQLAIAVGRGLKL